MDALIELLPLLFVGAYYLLTNRRKAEQRKRAAQAAREDAVDAVQSGPSTASAPTPFEQFLANLEESLAEANGIEPEPRESTIPKEIEPPPRRPVVPPAPIVTRPVTALESEFSAAPGSFDALVPVDHEAHGFGDENPFSEERFERAPAFVERAPVEATYDPHGLRPRRQKRAASDNWARVLRDPAAARDAFLLQTVFGPRGGRRADRR